MTPEPRMHRRDWGIYMAKRIVLALLCAVAAVLIPVNVATAATTASAVATLTIHADGSATGQSSSGWVEGHAFIVVKNVSQSNISVGKLSKLAPGQTVTLGTWGNKSEHTGLWYTLEAWFIHEDSLAYATESDSTPLYATQLRTLNKYIISHDTWSPTDNCSSFAMAAWNAVMPWDLQVSAGWPVNTPTYLMSSISNLPGASGGEAPNIPFDLFGVWYADGTKQLVRSTQFAPLSTR